MDATGPTILVVDDDADTCRNLADILTDLGYRVDTAPDGPAALELVRRRAYDVALLDFKMPGMDGLTLYREIRKLRAETVAIVVTAYATRAAAEQALARETFVPPKNCKMQIAKCKLSICILQFAFCNSDTRAKEDRSFTAVLIDMKLPEGDGSRVFRLVRDANPEARTVAITGHPSEMDELVREMVAEGADAVCCKPFDVPRLLSTLERLTAGQSGPPSGVGGES